MSLDSKKPTYSKRRRAVWSLLLLPVIALFILPLLPLFPSAGIDPSWHLFISHAFIDELRHGSEVVFTHGPYGPFHLPLALYVGNHQLYLTTMAVGGALALLLSLALAETAVAHHWIPGAVFVAAIIAALVFGVQLFFIFPLLLIVFIHPNCYRPVLTVGIVLALSLSGLIKASYFPPALFAVLVADLLLLQRGKLPNCALLFTGFLLLLWVIAGQSFADIIPYIQGSTELAAGYAQAMAVDGSIKELWVFLALAGVLCLVLFAFWVGSISRSDFWRRGLLIAPFAALTFIGFKTGFVRHDGHAMSGFAILIFSVALFHHLLRLESTDWRKTEVVLLVLVCSATFLMFRNIKTHRGVEWRRLVVDEAYKIRARALMVERLLSGNGLKWLDWQHEVALSEIKRTHKLKSVDGTVDIYPFDSTLVIAHGQNYRPRPVFQSYAAYTPKLLDLNRKSLESEAAPDYIWFAVGDIDRRIPSGMDSASWPVLLSDYCPVEVQDSFLLLKKCREPREVTFGEVCSQELQWSVPESLCVSDGGVWAELEVEETLLGRLAGLLFRPPLIQIQAGLEGGEVRDYRIIPGITKSGVLLSPLIESSIDLTVMDQAEHSWSKRVNELTVQLEPTWARWFYKEPQLRLRSISLEPKIDWTKVEGFSNLHRMMASGAFAAAPSIINQGNTQALFAHVPSRTSLPIEGEQKLSASFGIMEEAYTRWQNEGACFQIALVDNDARDPIWEQCLNPREVAADRGTHHVSLPLDGSRRSGKVEFVISTREGKNNRWGWTYWADVQLSQ